jgi:hypothetical protein
MVPIGNGEDGMAKKITKKDVVGKFNGRVTELDVSGEGANSAQLEFAITPIDGGQSKTFAVWFDTEARVFEAMASILTMAFRANMAVTVQYREKTGETPKAISVRVPAVD